MKKNPAPPSVPVEEQPYQVPDNWRWVETGAVIRLISGRDASPEDCNDDGKGIPYILGASNLDNNSFTGERWIENPAVESQRGDILLTVKGTIGKLYAQKEDRICISRQIMAIRPYAAFYDRYAYYFFLCERDTLRQAGHGLIPGISRKDVLSLPLPLPPLPEQRRIVERIENLFAGLDEAREKAQAVLDGYEYRRAAILHKAFTGELTAQWRAQHGVSFSTWEEKRLDETTIQIIDGDRGTHYPKRKKGELTSCGYCVFLNTGNVTKEGFNFDDVEFITKEKDELLRSGRLQRGDMILTTRGTIGNVALYDDSIPYERLRINSGMVIYRGGPEFEKKYLIWLYHSNLIKNQIRELQTGSAQPQLPIKVMNALLLPVPSVEEQREIVRVLDKVLTKERHTKQSAERVLHTVDLMKKAILGRAFRGLLGTNRPGESNPPRPGFPGA